MGRSIDEVIAKMPAQRRTRIEANAGKYAQELLGEVDSLTALRRALDLSQVEFAKLLGIGQNAVSQMEKRRDMRLSTLDKVASAASMQLEIALVAPDGTRIPLPNFHPWRSTHVAAEPTSSYGAAKRVAKPKRPVTHSTRAPAPKKRKTAK